MELATIADLRSVLSLQASDTSHDVFIEAAAAAAEDWMLKALRSSGTFEADEQSFDEYLAGNGKSFLSLPAFPVTEITSVHTVDDDGAEELIDDEEYRSDRFTLWRLTGYGTWPEGVKNIHVVWKAEWSTAELAAFKTLLFKIVGFEFMNQSSSRWGERSRSTEGLSQSWMTNAEFLADIESVLRRYRRPIV